MKTIKIKMKKLAVVLTALLLSIPTSMYAVSADTGGTLRVNYNMGWSMGGTSYGQAGAMSINGDIVYCLERTKDYANGSHYSPISENDMSAVGLSQAQMRKLSLMAYFGKQRAVGNPDWQSIVQNAIWNENEGGNANGYVLSATFNTKAKVDSAIATLEADVAKYYIKPSFHNTTQSIKIGETITLTDTNNVLNTFKVISSDGLTVTISGNKLIITAVTSGANLSSIVLGKNIPVNDMGSSIMFSYSNDKQKVGLLRIGDPERSFLDFEIEQNGSLELGKQDTNNNWIANTIFELSPNKTTITEHTTGSNGKVSVSDLPAGTYYVREKSVPAPLIVDKEWKTISIKAGEKTIFNAMNEIAVGRIEITKYGYSTLNNNADYLVQGTKFDIKNSNGNVVASVTTGANGKATSPNLPLGNYTVVETSVPSPLVLDTTPISVNIQYANQTTPIVVRSVSQRNKEAVGRIEVTKQSIHGDLIANAKFDIKNSNGNVVGSLSTGANGKAISPNLPLGNYTVVETSVPSPLVLDTTPISVSLKYKDQVTAVVSSGVTQTNVYQRSNITLNKIENNWDTIQTDFNGLKLSGATIELYAKNDIYEGTKLIYRSGELVGKEVTNSVGQVKFHNLPLGEYFAKETIAPEGYVLPEGTWNIVLSFDNGKVTTKITETETTVTNQTIYGKVNLVKQNGSNKLLEGAKFGLYTKEGTKLMELVSDVKGRIITPDLRYGEYYFKELEAPLGHWLSDEKITFTINEHEETIYLTTNNTPIEAKLFVHKFDSEEMTPLAGAKFKIRDLSSQEWVSIKYQEGKLVVSKDTWITDEEGEFLLEAFLPFGKYQLIEVEAPEGYVLSDPINFSIDEHQDYHNFEIIGDVLETSVPNRPIRSDVLIKKTDVNTGEELEKFEFKLTNLATGEEIVLSTDEDGLARFESQKYGRYMVEEIKVDGEYIRDTKPQFIDIVDDGVVYEINFENFKPLGEIKLHKVDYKDHTGVKDAVYGLYSLDGNLIEEATTNADGIAIFKHIALGEYTIKELVSPNGYILDETSYDVAIKYVDDQTAIIHTELTVEEMREVEIGTKASFVERDKETPNMITLVDEVHYENLIIGKEYTVNGKLMDKDTGEPIIIDGKEVTGTTTFVADKHDGMVEVYFVFDQNKLQTKTVVVFEDMYEEDVLVAVHHDITDVEQTVEIPGAKTKASFVERDKETPNMITLVDEVHYEGLVVGKEYTVNGKIMDKHTGEVILIDGKEVTGTTTFTAKASKGMVEVHFVFDQNKLKTDTVVVFEDVYEGERLIAVHHDLEDVEQTVEIPDAKTKASFVERNKEKPNMVTLVDEVKYSGLVVGKEYTVNGKLMDKHTGEVVLIGGKEVTGTTTFTAKANSGTINVYFTFNQNKLKTDAVVVFEDIYEGDRLIAVHHDLEDTDQTVNFIKIHINKKDSVSKKVLKNAEFTMYDINGNIIDVQKTNKEGLATFMIVEGESVTLKETKAPEGYKLSKEVIKVDASKGIDGNVYTVEYFNELLPIIELPQTGQGMSLLLILGVSSILMGISFYRRSKTEEEN